MPYWTTPTKALAAPTVIRMLSTVSARAPRAKSYTTGTSMKRNSCLQSATLTVGSSEKPAESSVAAA